MARISGVDIPREKRLEISLTYIFGVGRTRSKEICDGVGIPPDTRVRDLTEEEVAQLRAYVDGAGPYQFTCSAVEVQQVDPFVTPTLRVGADEKHRRRPVCDPQFQGPAPRRGQLQTG